jgi:hypothetical protein
VGPLTGTSVCPWPIPFRAAVLLYLARVDLTFFHAETLRTSWSSGGSRGYRHGSLATIPGRRAFITEAGIRLVRSTIGLDGALQLTVVREAGYAAQRILATWLGLVFFHIYLARWFSSTLAMAGTFLLGGLHFFTYHSYYYQPSSCLSFMVLTAALCLLSRDRTAGFYSLQFVGSFVRETSGILVLFYAAYHWADRRRWKHVAGLFIAWLVPQLTLRLIYGWPSYPMRTLRNSCPRPVARHAVRPHVVIVV